MSGTGHDGGSMRQLRALDEATAWELPREVQLADSRDDSVESMSTEGGLREEEGLDALETVENILSCTSDLNKNGAIKDIIIVVNTVEDEQLLFTTVLRNDLIIGMLEVAKMNWHTTQISLQQFEESSEDSFDLEEGEDYGCYA